MNIENLSIDKKPSIKNNAITVEFNIDESEEISISINNKSILNINSIKKIKNNTVELISDIIIKENDDITVVYSKI